MYKETGWEKINKIIIMNTVYALRAGGCGYSITL